MNPARHFAFTVDKTQNKIFVERAFDAPLDLVWAAWTEPEILDLWWAPKPWQARTKVMDFREGGYWLYAMVGPDGEEHWSRADYVQIDPKRSFTGIDGFCDAEGTPNPDLPRNTWENRFDASNPEQTIVHVELTFDDLNDLETTINMGFKEGFTAGLENLDAYISAQFYLRRAKKPNNAPRVSSYINCPGNTEEAFLFYRRVFGTEFVNGMQRFGDIPAEPGQPAMPDAVKNLVIHVELPILGGHLLMGTDAAKEMGFKVTPGNNMHINLEPDSKAEAERLFTELSAGGVVEMPLQNMFWGAWYASFSDRFGINWMVNFQPMEEAA
jgi:uncharacterized glyoxalase superfamily protein PhnB/uncharacterized protein YndB with AHSA1/START domain